jgi:hypothetical protein
VQQLGHKLGLNENEVQELVAKMEAHKAEVQHVVQQLHVVEPTGGACMEVRMLFVGE